MTTLNLDYMHTVKNALRNLQIDAMSGRGLDTTMRLIVQCGIEKEHLQLAQIASGYMTDVMLPIIDAAYMVA
jgi:hypothetical protein